MGIVVRFDNVKKSYGSKEALRGLSFEVRKGELLALLGPNGAGKSTSLNLLLGLRKQDSGVVEVFGGAPTECHVRQKVGITPQELSFPTTLTVRELLQFVQQHYDHKIELDALISDLNLGNLLDRRTGGLSGGEKRKIGLAMALVGNPELLVLDEPTTGMDIESRADLWKVIESLVQKGKTIVLTTHYLEEVEALASRVIVVDRGVAFFDGTVAEIKSKVEMRKVLFQYRRQIDSIKSIPGIEKVSQKADEVTLLTRNADLLIQELVTRKVEFKDLAIEKASLEEAFLVIRGKQ